MTFQFVSFLDFWMMNGHGPYVWASYIISLVALIVIAIIPVVQKRGLSKRLVRQQRINAANAQAARSSR